MNKRVYRKRVLILGALFLFLAGTGGNPINAGTVSGRDPVSKLNPLWPPNGKKIKCIINRDTWISSVEKERTGSNGGAKRLKVKGQQEYTLFDIDPVSLKGSVITGALLHIRSASPQKAPLTRLGVSTVANEWVEGTSRNYRPQKGSSSFIQAEHRERDWSYPGSTIMDVTFGRGHTVWKFADSSPPDKDGWQTFAVDPDVVAARVGGISHGFLVYDEVGSIWSLKKGQFKFIYFPNRFFYSRESRGNGPWLEVWTEGRDPVPPEAISSIRVDTDEFPAGEALVRWKTPKDKGGGKTLGFHVSYQRNGDRERDMPRYLIPMAGKPGQEVRMHIQDLPFDPGESITLTIKAVDSAGNVGLPFTKAIGLSSNPRVIDIPESDIRPFSPNKKIPEIGNLKIAIVDLLDKIDPQTGKMIPPQQEGYKSGNHLFSADKKMIRLQSARNETVAFQLILEGKAQDISINYTFAQNPKLNPRVFQFGYVKVADRKGKMVSILPDPLIPLKGPFSIPSTAGRISVSNQKSLSLICELYIPHDESPGRKKGKLVVSVGGEHLEFDVDLTVWGFTLPNKLSFIPEMNAYGTVSPFKGYEYYRLAHEHRTCINRLPYNWNGFPSFSPKWKGRVFDWAEWDKKVGPLLDGSAFKDLPRRHEPVDVFYLPFNENWPVSVFKNYRTSFRADEAFTEEYPKKLKKAFAAFARHFEEEKWHDTIFQFYLNNKIYYRKKYKKSSAPWIFDEPVNTQDFWALRWYGLLWKDAVEPVKGNTRMWYRGDISYSQFSRNILWGVMDVEYLGGNNVQKTRMKKDEQILFGKSYFSEYGTANKIAESNTQPVLWSLSAWSKGAMGVLPWQTIGSKKSWINAEPTALFYPHLTGPKPSVRLKAFRRGQQDVEYLTLFRDVFNVPRYAMADWLRRTLDFNESIDKASGHDAGSAVFSDVKPEELWEMRYRIGKVLSEKAPKYKRFLVDWEIPPWNLNKLPDTGYAAPSPQVERYKPDCDTFRP